MGLRWGDIRINTPSMTHRFPVKEISRQAGVGPATVDRVLHGRAHVSPQTRARVMAAIAELEGQEGQLAARGRRLFVDVVVEAPRRFSAEVQRASEAVLPAIGIAVFRPRFLFQEVMGETEIVDILERILKRGSNGVCLKARDLPGVRDAVDRLVAAGIPVVTLVTDIPGSARAAYLGVDNLNAGRTAGYLISEVIGAQVGAVLTTRSQESFFGEDERASGFAEVLATRAPGLRVLDAAGGGGVPRGTSDSVEAALEGVEDLLAVYSMGGGNEAVLAVLEEGRHVPNVYIAHDLDSVNRRLLAEGRINFLLNHDLKQDMRGVFLAIAAHHRLYQAKDGFRPSVVQVLTPMNVPV